MKSFTTVFSLYDFKQVLSSGQRDLNSHLAVFFVITQLNNFKIRFSESYRCTNLYKLHVC